MTMLDVRGVAELLGVKPATVNAYVSRGILPPADGYVMTSPWWHDRTIRAWMETRPGQGAGGGRPRKTEDQ